MATLQKKAPNESVGYSVLQVKSINSETRTIKGIATTPTPDRVGDIVEPLGVTFKNPLVLLHQHDHDSPVGTVVFDKPTAKGITFTATLPVIEVPGKLKDRVDMAWQEVALGLVRAVSIGFRPIEYSWMDDGGIRFIEVEVYELSLVSVPAQADAVITSVKSMGEPLSEEAVQAIKSFDKQQSGVTQQAVGQKPVVKLKPSGVSESKSINNVKPKEVLKMATYADQIKAFKDTLAQKEARMVELMTANDGATLDQAEAEEYETLTAECKAVEEHIKRFEVLEQKALKDAKAVEDKSKSISTQTGTVYHVQAENEKLEKGIEFARYAMCKHASNGNPQMALELAKAHYPRNERVIKALEVGARGQKLENMMKATVEAGTTLDPTWAAPLVQYQNFAGDFIEFLRPQTIIGQFGLNNVPSLRQIPFNVRIVGQTSGGNADWVGEGAPKPLTSFDFNAVNLGWSKVAAISVLTNELIRFSDPSAERLVRDSLASAIIARIDQDFVDPAKAAVTNVSPASITNGATSVPSSGSDVDAVRADFQALLATFIAARNPARQGVLIMDSVTALALSMMRNPLGASEFPNLTVNGGTFMGYPVIVSDYLPTDSDGSIIILANASDIYFADDGQVTIDVSREASLQMLDNPTNNSATGTATTMVSMFQTNSTAILAERYINWARRRTSAVAYLTGVNYNGAGV